MFTGIGANYVDPVSTELAKKGISGAVETAKGKFAKFPGTDKFVPAPGLFQCTVIFKKVAGEGLHLATRIPNLLQTGLGIIIV